MFITREKADLIQQLSPYLVEKIPFGAIYMGTDREKIIWKTPSKLFDVPNFQVGNPLRPGGGAFKCIQNRNEYEERLPRELYGMRLVIHYMPVLEGEDVIGTILLVLPKLHPVHRAFEDFAPIISNMFPEGAVLYMTDFERTTRYQASARFQLADLEEGNKLKAGSAAMEAMQKKAPVRKEFDASVYGVPVLLMNYPLFDEDDSSKVVASFGLALPKASAVQLRQHSSSISNSLEDISSVIEQLAVSANQINENEQKLNDKINTIKQYTAEITEVLNFIKQIADETKMLGLNAAIEAARAGDAGKGFGVVAEEIRKLSDESKQTVIKIKKLTDSINTEVQQTAEWSHSTLTASQEQAAATQEINATIEEITSLSDELAKMAQYM
jgi:hypothetical protein